MDTLQAVLAGLYDDEPSELEGESEYLKAAKKLSGLIDKALLQKGKPTRRRQVKTVITIVERE